MNSTIIYIVLGLNLIWLIVLTVLIVRWNKKYQKILSGVKGDSLEKILKLHMERLEKAVNQNVEIKEQFDSFIKFSRQFLYRIGFKRFNPFQNTGGDQSFALSILDENGDGIVISSMHAREGTRVYAKPVAKGKELSHKFSTEERDVVEEAMK